MNDARVRQTHDAAPVESANEARQAVTGHGVRNVLLWGCVSVVIAFVVVYFIFFTGTPPTH